MLPRPRRIHPLPATIRIDTRSQSWIRYRWGRRNSRCWLLPLALVLTENWENLLLTTSNTDSCHRYPTRPPRTLSMLRMAITMVDLSTFQCPTDSCRNDRIPAEWHRNPQEWPESAGMARFLQNGTGMAPEWNRNSSHRTSNSLNLPYLI